MEQLPEGEQRLRLWQAVTRALLASGRPTLLVVDDLQWADRESLQYMHYLLRAVAGARLMVLATARPEDIGAETAAGTVLTARRCRPATAVRVGAR